MILAALGKREVYERGADRNLSTHECSVARRHATSIALRAALIGVAAATIAWLV